jgi:arsenate reductase
LSSALKLYSYRACSTCRKALAWLNAQGLEAEVIDITAQPPTLAELKLALTQLGRKRLLNTSGQSYRALGAAAVAAMDDNQLLAALVADGRLIKRPVLIAIDTRGEERLITGFKPQEWQDLLG